ncbi:hypothetical protein [Streptomyces sp. TR06-5]|uniref:hypothetical protein n=1 Tax=Streptomyces sp. TR06-5 TaxID=3385976 RepID=UPI00399FFE0D
MLWNAHAPALWSRFVLNLRREIARISGLTQRTLASVKELLGHAHIRVTAAVYAHVRPRLKRDAINAIGAALERP